MSDRIRVTAREVGRFEPPPRTTLTGELADTRFVAPVGTDLFIDRVSATGVDLSGLRIWALSIVGSTFERCDFSELRCEMVPSFGSGTPSLYRDCHFDRMKLDSFQPIASRFERCTFEQMEMRGARIDLAEFVDCTFSGRITDTVFSGTPYESGIKSLPPRRPRNEFRGNDFSRCGIRGVDFVRGIDVTAQRWPVGPDYLLVDRLPERLRAFRALVDRWPDGPKRAEALFLCERFSDWPRYGNAAFVQKTSFSVSPQYSDDIWGLLQSAID